MNENDKVSDVVESMDLLTVDETSGERVDDVDQLTVGGALGDAVLEMVFDGNDVEFELVADIVDEAAAEIESNEKLLERVEECETEVLSVDAMDRVVLDDASRESDVEVDIVRDSVVEPVDVLEKVVESVTDRDAVSAIVAERDIDTDVSEIELDLEKDLATD